MSAFGGKADTIKLPALKILSGCIATALATRVRGMAGGGSRILITHQNPSQCLRVIVPQRFALTESRTCNTQTHVNPLQDQYAQRQGYRVRLVSAPKSRASQALASRPNALRSRALQHPKAWRSSVSSPKSRAARAPMRLPRRPQLVAALKAAKKAKCADCCRKTRSIEP